MDAASRQPFVLKSLKAIPGHAPDPNRVFDPKRQLWLLRDSGLPVVLESASPNSRHRSDWGETVTTRTSEGIDQSESTLASQWGETIITETSEGIDQSESLRASDFGETIVTNTSEGIDQSERISDEDLY